MEKKKQEEIALARKRADEAAAGRGAETRQISALREELVMVQEQQARVERDNRERTEIATRRLKAHELELERQEEEKRVQAQQKFAVADDRVSGP